MDAAERERILAEARAHLDGSWSAERFPPATNPPIEKSVHNGLRISTRENALIEYSPPPADEPADTGPFFGDHRDELLVESVGEALSGLRREFKRQLAKRDKEIDALREKLDALSAPRGRKRA